MNRLSEGSPSPTPDDATGPWIGLDPVALGARLHGWGFNPVHAGPVLRGLLARGDLSEPDASARWPQGLRERLEADLAASGAAVLHRAEAPDGTVKLLLRFADGATVESVLMPDFRSDRAAGCLSSQVGCAMGCDFCATAQSSFRRNLTVAEILHQFLALRREAVAMGRRLQTVVFMGMGEPTLNLPSVLEAVRRIGDNALGGLGWRQITVSTVGIVPGIDALDRSGLNVNLAVSLHAPDEETRRRLLPTARHFPIAEILEAADRFQSGRPHPVVIQYCLLDGVNDSPAHAEALAALFRDRRMHVNLLRYNPTGVGLQGIAYRPSPEPVLEAFEEVLRGAGVVAHVRRSRGQGIAAACGQLRRTAG